MADESNSYMPAEWVDSRYHPIGGSYDSLDRAIAAVESHFHNKHGGSGSLQVFKPEGDQPTAAVVEAGPATGGPLMVRSIYKVVVVPTVR